MVRINHTQRFPLGTRVSKYFNGYKDPFQGTVDQHAELTDFYHISYDDGDSEEMTEDDVDRHLLSLPKPQRPPKPQKTLNVTKPSKSPKASKPRTPPPMKRANSDSSISLSSPVAAVSPRTASSTNLKVLSLNANAPGLMRSNSFTDLPSSNGKTQEPLSVSIPALQDEEYQEEEEEEEEEEDDEEEDTSTQATPEEINQLIGKPVEKTRFKEGCVISVAQGIVSSYFPATKMFRVIFFEGGSNDLSYQEVFNSIPADLRPVGTKKRKAENISRKKEKNGVSNAPSASPKRQKMLDLNAASSTFSKSTGPKKRGPTANSPISVAESPVSSVVRETDMLTVDDVEFNIVRKVLYIIVSTVNNTVMEAQLEALSSTELKDKEALEVFVQKSGLTSLVDLLSKWENQADTEQGVLLVLKALAVLPGITKDAVIDSNIGRKVRVIEKHGSFRDSTIPGLASWVIKKMKADIGVDKTTQASSKSVNGKSHNEKETRSRGSSSPKRNTSTSLDDAKRASHPPTAKPASSAKPTKAKVQSTSNGVKRSNSASHLLNLLNSRNGRDASTARRDHDIFGNHVTPQSRRRLGTANNWKARRSTVVLDQVSRRLTENAQDVETQKTQQVEEDNWKPSKISFADQSMVCPFDKDIEVSKLLVYRPPGSSKAAERPSIKRHSGPLRSILRVREQPPPSPQESSEQASALDSNLAPPTVHATARPVLEPIVMPSDRPSLTDVDGTAESPMFDTSKLSKVVSPTEKRKQGFSPPPCIPTSEQPPLDFTEEGDEGEDGEVAGTADNSEVSEAAPEKPESKPAEQVQVYAEALSPVVSEDESSDDDELSDAEANAQKAVTTPQTGAALEEPPVQQVATTSA